MTRSPLASRAFLAAACVAALLPVAVWFFERAPPQFRVSAPIAVVINLLIVFRAVRRVPLWAPERSALPWMAAIGIGGAVAYELLLLATTARFDEPVVHERVQVGFGLWSGGLTDEARNYVASQAGEGTAPAELLLAFAAVDSPELIWKRWTVVVSGLCLVALLLASSAAFTQLLLLLRRESIAPRGGCLAEASAAAGGAAVRRLCVVVPGLGGNEAAWEPLVRRLAKEPALAASKWIVVRHRTSWWKLGSALEKARGVAAQIDQAWRRDGGFESVLLLGHSLGGVLARRAWLQGSRDPATGATQPWAAKVGRIVLLASINNGIATDRGLLLRSLGFVLQLGPFASSLLRDFLSGSDFIANLRIDWIRRMHEDGAIAPQVVQVLGTRDGIVHRHDSLDVEQFQGAWHVDIADARHGDLFRLDRADDPEARYALLRDAILAAPPPSADVAPTERGPDRVVFVLHGIRDHNRGWVEDVARRLRERAKGVTVEQSRYRRVSALQFAVPSVRRRRVRWLQDRYAYWLARNPKVKFDFIGHSNGTYLLGRSLARVTGMRFERIALVGSVLPEDHWRLVRPDQFQRIRNDRAAADIPVALLCSGLRGLGQRDIGTGGFNGFIDLHEERLVDVAWHDGGHGAALREESLDALVDFVIDEKVQRLPPLIERPRRSQRWIAIASRIAPFAFAAAALAAAWFGYQWITEPQLSIDRVLLLGIGVSTALVVLHVV